MKATQPRAYSYVRFSTPEQQHGDSHRRQTQMAAAYAAKHGLQLDTELNMADLGVSAYRGRNLADGALGMFLQLAEAGDIPHGSFLLVEALDRLSRQTARRAVRVLESIVESGVTVVTLDNEKRYTVEGLDSDPMDLMMSMMFFIRANEESATKARRLKAAWHGKRVKAVEQGKPMTSKCPAWLRLKDDRSGYDAIEQRAGVVREIFRWTIAGIGQHQIALRLNDGGVKTWGRGAAWQRSYIAKILRNAATVGTYVPHTADIVDGKKVRTAQQVVEGFYPPVIDWETFDAVQGLLNAGTTPKTVATKGVQNVLAGLAKCGRCGATMTRVMKGKRSQPKLACTTAKRKLGCQYVGVRCDLVEDAIRDFAEWVHGVVPSPDAELQDQYERAERAVEATQDRVQNLVGAIESSGGSMALIQALRANEVVLIDAVAERNKIAEVMATGMTNRVDNLVDQFQQATIEGDLARTNGALRLLFSHATVDFEEGVIGMRWRHAPSEVVRVRYHHGFFTEKK
ncbi:recombinase family protein [Phyllobacterium sp. A18/5-2]|uniref:recombinase family protein n=1 Tax=Phyllobacterium sp. A18/5-2 TaxID=2978392 RepID=UPI0021C78905|nr:recombinase family protein [Phyllobacterium sp. A18/5-2]UXN65399.1 recombinase family protein [Phyllobacterium sp. A18/5-2]